MPLNSPIARGLTGGLNGSLLGGIGVLTPFNTLFPGAAALYSLRNLNDPLSNVVRVRRSTDDSEQGFKFGEVTGGALLNWVVPPSVQALYSNAMWFDGTNNYVDFNFVPSGNDSFRTRGTINLQLNSSVQAILGNRGAANTGFFLLTINQTSSTYKLRPHINTNTGLKSFDSVATLNYGTEYTVDVRADLNGNFELWIDGVFDSQIDISTNTAFVWGIGTFRAGARADTAADRALGYIRDVEYYRAGVLVSDWLINGNTNAAVVDNTGSNNGTVFGSPALFTGQGFNGAVSVWYDQRVSTDNDRMYFDGVDNWVSIPNNSTNNSRKYQLKYIYNDTNDQRLASFSDGVVNGTIFITLNSTNGGGDSDIVVWANTFGSPIGVDNSGAVNGDIMTLSFQTNSSGEVVSGTYQVNDNTPVALGSTTATARTGFAATTRIGGHDGVSGQLYVGAVWDVRISNLSDVLLHSYNGNGNLNEDWTDQVGSANGTVVGSPRRCLPDLSVISNDATQTTAANQPLIVENGALITLNGKPAIKNSGTKLLEVLGSIGTFDFLHNGTTSSVFSVASFGSSSNPNAINTLLSTFNGSSLNIGYFLAYDDRSSVSANNAYLVRVGNGTGSGQYPVDNSVNNSITPQTQVLISSIVDANNATASARDIGKINGGSNLSNNSGTFAPSASNASNELQLFAADDSIHLQGFAQEVIIFGNDQTVNRADIESNMNNYYKVF